jgi:hypothetical protein
MTIIQVDMKCDYGAYNTNVSSENYNVAGRCAK